MTNRPSREIRSLFIVDNDYGALGLVMYLLENRPMAARALVLLPTSAFDVHNDRLPVTCQGYRSLQDILEAVERHSPDIVCLMSGYSYAYQGLLSIAELRDLIARLRDRDCAIATSDPYLGTFGLISSAPARNDTYRDRFRRRIVGLPGLSSLIAGPIGYYRRLKLRRYVRGVTDTLDDVVHMCPVPQRLLPTGGPDYLPFYNPLCIRSDTELRRIAERVSAYPDIATDRARWLFVIAGFDLRYQQEIHGERRFAEIVSSKLREALENGKHPCLIAPSELIDAVSRHFGPDDRVSLLPACAFDEFQHRLFDAEMVFYWQIFSTSTFLRLLNGLPTFFFDQGNTARSFPPMHEAGLKCYYVAEPPIYLDIEDALDPATLSELAAGFAASAHRTREIMAGALDPEELASAIIAPDP